MAGWSEDNCLPEQLPPSFSTQTGVSPWSKGRNLPRYQRCANWCTLGVQMGGDRECKARRIARFWYGEGGIRTLGPPQEGQRFSRPPRSTAPAPLRLKNVNYL